MQHCKVRLTIESSITLDITAGADELAEDLVERIQDGCPPMWIEELIKEGLDFETITVDNYKITGRELEPEEELDFS